MKIILLLLVAFLSLTVLAQSNSVQITGGKFDIPGGGNIIGTAVMQSNVFTSNSILGTSGSPWANVCRDLDCRPGSAFSMPNSLQIGDNGHRIGSFTINGTTYQNVYFNGLFQFDPIRFQIPRIVRRKGLIFFREEFKMTGFFRVCRINDFTSGCPANDILFEGNIYGHGDLTVMMQVVQAPDYNGNRVYLKPLQFEYQFKP
jgi:hypothetical protein